LERLFSIEDRLSDDPIQIEITLLHPSNDQPIKIQGVVGIKPQPEITEVGLDGFKDHVLLDRLARINAWEQRNLPNPSSRIAVVLFRLLGTGNLQDRIYTMKQVVHATGYSERAIRQLLVKFEQHGWIERKQGDQDKRNTFIYPTAAIKTAYQAWLRLHQEER